MSHDEFATPWPQVNPIWFKRIPIKLFTSISWQKDLFIVDFEPVNVGFMASDVENEFPNFRTSSVGSIEILALYFHFLFIANSESVETVVKIAVNQLMSKKYGYIVIFHYGEQNLAKFVPRNTKSGILLLNSIGQLGHSPIAAVNYLPVYRDSMC